MVYETECVGEDLEDIAPMIPQGKSLGTVLPYVGVACLGAILFGYHLGYDLANYAAFLHRIIFSCLFGGIIALGFSNWSLAFFEQEKYMFTDLLVL